MKIICANKYYFMNGGAERYMFSVSDHLRAVGHDVIPFSVRYAQTLPNEYADFFTRPIGDGEESKLEKIRGGVITKARIAARSIYSCEARKAIGRLMDKTNPDLLYCLNIANHISPSIIDAACERKIPVVMRLSDYYLTCPCYLYLHKGQICTDCDRGFYHALGRKCIYGNFLPTLSRVTGMYIQKVMGIYNKADAFVTTTQFMKQRLLDAGYPESKIHHIPTFVNASKWEPRYDNDGYILFYGRLAREKGIDALVEAYNRSKLTEPLLIVGGGNHTEYIKGLKERVAAYNNPNIQFLGRKQGEELHELVRGAKYVMVPSIWYDNAPNVVYESFAAGKPVIASALGGLVEQVTEECGILVEPGNADEMAEAMKRLSGDPELIVSLGRAARHRVETVNAIELHTSRLMKLFESVAEGRK